MIANHLALQRAASSRAGWQPSPAEPMALAVCRQSSHENKCQSGFGTGLVLCWE